MQNLKQLTDRRLGRRLLLVALVVCVAPVMQGRAWAAEDAGGVSIEWAYLATYPEADCTKIHVYVKNTSKFPVFLEGIHLNDRILDLDLDRQDALSLAETTVAAVSADHMAHDERAATLSRRAGSLQWHRALPNPVEPGRITDVTVSLWGTVNDAAIRIPVRGGGELRWDAEDEKRALCLSHIAFDPADPNKIYVYCENKTDKDIAIDHILVNTEKVEISKSIPLGNAIEAGKKTCFIVRPKQKMIWGRYAGVGVVGKGGEKVVAVVRVINFFPIGSWSVDTRSDILFDSIDLHKPMPSVARKNDVSDGISPLIVPAADPSDLPYQAYYDGRDPTCDRDGWEVNARRSIHIMNTLHRQNAIIPYYTHVCLTNAIAYAFFSDLPDLVLVNPYRILYSATSPFENGRRLSLARTWADPRPVVAVPEAFVGSASKRTLTPDEVAFGVWSEIGEGAKGVRYFTRGGAARARTQGYDDLPGVALQIARDNCSLQLLKCFLRIGDTCDLVHAGDDTVVCKSILCGEYGIVVVALNTRFQWSEGVPTQWSDTGRVQFSCTLPRGQANVDVLEVQSGLRYVAASRNGPKVLWESAGVRSVRVFLLLEKHERDAPIAMEEMETAHRGIQNVRLLHSATVSDTLVNEYARTVEHIAGPLLRVSSGPQPRNTVIHAGLGMAALHDDLLAKLRLAERTLDKLPREDTRVRAAKNIAAAYATVGEHDHISTCCQAAVESLAPRGREDLIRYATHLLNAVGRYGETAALLQEMIGREQDNRLKSRLLDDLISHYHWKLRDYDSAIQWAHASLSLPGMTHGRETAIRHEIASMLLASSKAADAIDALRSIPVGRATSHPTDFLLACAYERLGQVDNAVVHYRRAIRMSPSYAPIAQYRIGILLLHQCKYDDARQELQQVLDSYPSSDCAESARRMVHLMKKGVRH